MLTRGAPRALRVAGDTLAVILAGVLLALEVWTLVPAPTLVTLALAVAVPEIAPWGIAAAAIVFAIVQLISHGGARLTASFAAALAAGCACVPFVLLPATAGAATAALRAAGIATGAPGAGAPYDLGTSFAGYAPPRGVRVRRNIPIVLRGGARSALDLYLPATDGPHPTLVTIYGGAWIFGSRADTAEIDRTFAGLGYTVIAIDYRHAPRYVYPVQIDDVRDALAAIAAHARAWDVDPARVAIFGRSAGAELALLAAYEPEPVTVVAAIGYYTPVDLVRGYDDPPVPDPANVQRILRAYIGAPPGFRMSAYVGASPVVHVRPGLPPTLLIGGARDELVRIGFQHELRDILRAHGDRVVSIELPWSNHAFDTIPNGVGGQIARFATVNFLRATLPAGAVSGTLVPR